MIHLANGCSCSKLSVYPKNWQDSTADINCTWYINYRFYDPAFKDDPQIKGRKQKVIKGMNSYNTLKERQEATRILLEGEMTLLKQQNYNPITGFFEELPDEPIDIDHTISSATGFIRALELAKAGMKKAASTMRDIQTVINGVTPAAAKLGITRLPISKVTRKHIKAILKQCELDNKEWSANRFNTYRTYLKILFGELIEAEATEIDPLSKIKKQKTVKRIRQRLSLEERKVINEHLQREHYSFWRFMHIFFHSGARETEMMLIKKEDVDLRNQRFKMIIKKGKNYREVMRTIKDVVLPLWIEVVDQAKYGDYLFAKNLAPGKEAIKSDQINRRWRTHVKEKLGITADFYSLKHSNLDETAEILSAVDAQKMAAHSSLVVTMDHYLLGEKEREHKRLKEVNNSL